MNILSLLILRPTGLLRRRRINGMVEYKVKWKGYDDVSWEPEENCAGCPDVIAAFDRLKAEQRRRKQQQNRERGSPETAAASAAVARKRPRAVGETESDDDSDVEVLGDVARRRKAKKDAKLRKATKKAKKAARREWMAAEDREIRLGAPCCTAPPLTFLPLLSGCASDAFSTLHIDHFLKF